MADSRYTMFMVTVRADPMLPDPEPLEIREGPRLADKR